MIRDLIDEAVKQGARRGMAAALLGLDPRTIERWRAMECKDDGREGPRQKPKNALGARERQKVLETVNLPEYCDKSPKQIVPALADRDIYIASEATMYRILRAAGQQKHRSATRPPTKRHRPQALHATGPNRVWSADITWLPTTVRGLYFKLCMVMDVFSRKIVGYAVHEDENADLTAAVVASACQSEAVERGQLTLHTDNGGAVKGATVLATLQRLGVASSFSRPAVSNDNPYSEALFRTAKYSAAHPTRYFETLEDARRWAAAFVHWYNTGHRHSAIRFVTPDERHSGREKAILAERREVYAAARHRHPERFPNGTRNWTPIASVTLNPDPKANAA